MTSPVKALVDCALYTFIDSAWLHGRDPLALAHELCRGGSDLIQLRAKDWSEQKIHDIAISLIPVLHAHGVRLVINDHLEVARAVGADFCHLGQEDFFDSGYSHISELPPAGMAKPMIGLSTHAPIQAERAVTAGVDYVAIGPVFRTGTKPQAAPVTLEYVRWAGKNLSIPWFAIGGITLENLGEVLAAGATRICVVSAILNSKNVEATCRDFKTRLNQK